MDDLQVTVSEDAERRRYTATVDGVHAGFAGYVDRGGRRLFVHTEVDDAFEGKGVGSRLVAGALDDVRARGLRIVPLCPFVAAYIERHDEYADLVDAEAVRRLDS